MLSFLDQARTARTQLAARLAVLGFRPAALILAQIAMGMTTIFLIATRHNWIAGIVFILSVFCGLLRPTDADSRLRDLSQAFDLIVLSGVPFAFAVSDVSRALAACFLLFGLVTLVAASLFARHLHRLDNPSRLIGILSILPACAMPEWFSLIAYSIGIAAFFTAGAHVSFALTRSSV